MNDQEIQNSREKHSQLMLFNDEKNNYEAGFWQIWWKKWNKKLLFRPIKFRIRDPTINIGLSKWNWTRFFLRARSFLICCLFLCRRFIHIHSASFHSQSRNMKHFDWNRKQPFFSEKSNEKPVTDHWPINCLFWNWLIFAVCRRHSPTQERIVNRKLLVLVTFMWLLYTLYINAICMKKETLICALIDYVTGLQTITFFFIVSSTNCS